MTTIELTDAAIGRGLSAAVPALTLSAGPGAPTVVAVETDERPMLVSMLLGGRLRPDTGTVTIDGSRSLDEVRRRTALVDTPTVAEPTAGASLAVAVAEEFSFSGHSTSRTSVSRFLLEHGLREYAKLPLRALKVITGHPDGMYLRSCIVLRKILSAVFRVWSQEIGELRIGQRFCQKFFFQFFQQMVIHFGIGLRELVGVVLPIFVQHREKRF